MSARVRRLAEQIRDWLGASITNRATAFAAALTLGTVFLVGVGNMVYVLHLAHEARMEVLKDDANRTAQRLELILDGLADDGANLARNPALVSAALDSSGQDLYLRPILQKFKPRDRTPRALCMTDYKGAPLACTASARIAAEDELIRHTIENDHAHAAIVVTAGRASLLRVITPVVYFQSGRPEGALVAEYELGDLLAAAAGELQDRYLQLDAGDSARAIALGEPTEAVQRVAINLRPPLDQLRLSLVIGMPSNKLQQPLIEVALAYLLLALLLLPMILLLARRLMISVTQRLVHVSRVAESIAATGELDVRLDDAGNDEISRLAHSFMTMTDRIREVNRGLEQLVASRTRELVNSEAKLRDLVNTTDGIVWEADAQSLDFVFVSDQAERLLGFPKDDWLRPGFWLLHLHPDDRDRALASRSASTARIDAHDIEYRLLASDGRVVWLRDMVTVVTEQGEPRWLRGLMIDITAGKQAADALREAASVFEFANEGIMITDPQGDILNVNEAFCRITGYSRDEVIGRNPRLLKSGRHDADFYARMWQALQETGYWTSEMWNRRKDGAVIAEMQTISAVRGKDGELLRYVSLFSDITTIKEHQKQLERIAHFDALTGLPNRVLLADRLHQAMVQAQRHGTLLGVVYLDLDGFKAVNDTHSHLVGDKLLTALSGRMKDALRDGDTLARLGGDEFVGVLLDLQNHESCALVIDRLLAAASEPVRVDGRELRVSASIGVSFFPQSEEVDADQLMRQADQAMYQAKQSGKNRYHVFDADHDRTVRGLHETLDRIRHALAHDEFVLHYQPKVNMRTGQLIGAEALVRWQHPDQGQLAPASFLPLIEGHPLCVALGDWVIDTALGQIESWRRAGLHLPVSVNVDAMQFEQPGFMESLRQHLARHPAVEPGDLELEVLETSALEDISHLSLIIDACQQIGVGFALDDFGTGYSSLTYLRRLPADLLKIDQSFVRDMLEDPEDLAILEGVLGLAAAFRRRVIAEGVETLAHGEMLLQMGCEFGQGYAIARAMPGDQIPAWAAGWRPDPRWQGRPAVSRDDLPLIFAMVEHRAWVSNLHRCINDGADAPPLSTRECRFGVWLDTTGRARHAGHPAMARITALHERIHRQGRALLASRQRDPLAPPAAALEEIDSLRDALLSELEQLIA